MDAMLPSGELQDMCKELDIDDELLADFIQGFHDDLELGLSTDYRNSSLKCYLSQIQDIPAGYERGQYLSLTFCSPEVKVSLITLRNKSYDLQTKQFTIPDDVFKATAEQLFDFLTECIYDFSLDNNIHMAGLPMGITFGFPCEHRNIKSAILVEWTREIECAGAVGSDIVEMLEKSISKRADLDVKIMALVNDSTETLIASMWKLRKCKIATYVESGHNISYVERIEKIPKFKRASDKPCMIINVESGNFGSNGVIEFLRTEWDRDLDAHTRNPGRYLFDKMTGKYYIGELVRLIVMSAIHKHIMFKGSVSTRFSEPWSVDSTKIIEISKDWSGQAATRNLLRALGFSAPTPQECVDFRFVCQRVWTRSAHLSAAALSSVLQYMRCKHIGIGYSGSLLVDNQRYLDVLRSKVRQILDQRVQFQFMNLEHSSGLGAALAACVANTDIAMFTEQLEEPEELFYADIVVGSVGRKIKKTTRVVSETTLQLTPKRQKSHEPALKKGNDSLTKPSILIKRRSVSSVNSEVSRSGSEGASRSQGTSNVKIKQSKHGVKERQDRPAVVEPAKAPVKARDVTVPLPPPAVSTKRPAERPSQPHRRDSDTSSHASGISRDEAIQKQKMNRSVPVAASHMQSDRAKSNVGSSSRKMASKPRTKLEQSKIVASDTAKVRPIASRDKDTKMNDVQSVTSLSGRTKNEKPLTTNVNRNKPEKPKQPRN